MQVLMKAQDFQSLLVLAKPMSTIQMILPCQDLTACLETIQNLSISNLERIFFVNTIFFSFCWRWKSNQHPDMIGWQVAWKIGAFQEFVHANGTCGDYGPSVWDTRIYPNCSLMDQKSFQNQLRLGSFILWCTGFLLRIWLFDGAGLKRYQQDPECSRFNTWYSDLSLSMIMKTSYFAQKRFPCFGWLSDLWLSTYIYILYTYIWISKSLPCNQICHPFAPWFWVLFNAPEREWCFASRHQTWMGRMRSNEYVCCIISSQHDAMGLFGIGVLLGNHKKTCVFHC